MNENNRRPNRRFGQIPVKEGEVYEVEVEGVGEKGDGIAKVNGYVIIVPNTNKGDKVKVKVTAVRGKVSFGEVVSDDSSKETQPQDQQTEEAEKTSEDKQE